MLLVLGRSDLFLKLEIFKKAIAVIPIVLGIVIGIYWMLISSVFVGVIHYYINSYYSGKLLNYPFFSQVKDIMPAFVISFIGASIAFLICIVFQVCVYSGFIFWNNLFILLISCATGAFVSFMLFKHTNNPEFKEIRNIIIRLVGKFRKR